MSGGDVIDYRTAKDFPFYLIVNNKVPQIPDESQHVALLSFVLHHERHPEQIVGELSRIVKPEGRVVVFEHNPQGDTPAQHNLERQRIHFADLLHTVVWQNVDIPVPGTYKTRDEWREIFESRGFSLLRDESFEGTPLLYGSRQLLVFERIDAGLASLRPPAGGRAKFKGR
jgi:ubiquinone/menaquinone biosynthesis C-methylase UbiE